MSFTSRHSGSSCCPWRGRGWNHLMGMAHGAGGGALLCGGFPHLPRVVLTLGVLV